MTPEQAAEKAEKVKDIWEKAKCFSTDYCNVHEAEELTIKFIVKVLLEADKTARAEEKQAVILEIIRAIDRSNGSMGVVKEFCHLLLREGVERSGRWEGKDKSECGIHTNGTIRSQETET